MLGSDVECGCAEKLSYVQSYPGRTCSPNLHWPFAKRARSSASPTGLFLVAGSILTSMPSFCAVAMVSFEFGRGRVG
jgi:hypothetical protein